MSTIKVDKITKRTGSTLTVGEACTAVKVDGNDVRSNAYKASDAGNIISQSGTTITLGASGDTITLACGATQTGFGQASSSVEYCTTAKTSPFTATAGKGFFVNTTGSAVTVTLPSSPSAGDVVAIADYANTFGNNAVTICRNSSKIDGQCANAVISQSSVAQALIYVDATKGWKSIQKQESGVNIPTTFITATGGTETTSGDYKIHSFTSDGTFNVTGAATPNANSKVDFLIIAGGGGGGKYQAGGGGAGGYRESKCNSVSGCWTSSPLAVAQSIQVEATSYPVIVGAGGVGGLGAPNNYGGNGSNSSFSVIVSAGGGVGGEGGGPEPFGYSRTGGSGGGGGEQRCGSPGNVPGTSPPQGNDGGDSTALSGGGGGGAGGAGANKSPGPTAPSGAAGGSGVTSHITGSPVARAGGGGGGCGGGCGGTASSGGGAGASPVGANGTANTGGGGGGGGSPGAQGGTGGSGIVILRYKFQ